MDGSSYLSEMQSLFDADALIVEHEPPTERYQRGETLLNFIIRNSTYLGQRTAALREGAIEIALWAKDPRGKGCGLYTSVRLFYDGIRAYFGVLFCFWDGQHKSPCIKSLSTATERARAEGYT